MKVPVHISKRFAVLLVTAAAVVVAAGASGIRPQSWSGYRRQYVGGSRCTNPTHRRPKRPWTCRPAN